MTFTGFIINHGFPIISLGWVQKKNKTIKLKLRQNISLPAALLNDLGE